MCKLISKVTIENELTKDEIYTRLSAIYKHQIKIQNDEGFIKFYDYSFFHDKENS